MAPVVAGLLAPFLKGKKLIAKIYEKRLARSCRAA
jgi:hypothetical protein